MKVFPYSKGFIQDTSRDDYRYVTVNTGNTKYFGKAPILGIKIEESTDVGVTKNLNGGFNLVTFPDNPVGIQISGIVQMLQSNKCTSTDTKKTSNSIQDFYAAYKASKSGSNTVQISIGTQTYQAVLVRMTRQSWQSDRFPGMMSYSIFLIGRKKGK